MFRKIVTVFLAVLMVFALCVTIVACGDEDNNDNVVDDGIVDDIPITDDDSSDEGENDNQEEEPELSYTLDYRYIENTNSYEVVGYSGELVDLVIPSEYEGLMVTRIGNYCFRDCLTLKTAVLPSTITHVGGSAFSGCTNLDKINLPESVEFVGCYAFSKSGVLEKDENGIYYVGNWACQYDRDDYSDTFIVKEGTIGIASGAFIYYGPSTIVIPEGVKYLNSSAFADNNNLTSVTLPESIQVIPEMAFSACNKMTNVELPSSITTIENRAFSRCTSLSGFEIGKNVTYVGEEVFRGCTNLCNIDVDDENPSYCAVDGVLFNKDKTKLIQYSVGKNISSYSIPSSVRKIENYAFWGAKKLYSLTIQSQFSVGENAFWGCSNVIEAYNLTGRDWNEDNDMLAYMGFNEGQVRYIHTSIDTPSVFTLLQDKFLVYSVGDECTIVGYYGDEVNVSIPQSVTAIGNSAFSFNVDLQTVIIPSSVNKIGDGAFSNCTNLTDVQIAEGLVSIGSQAFEKTALNAIVIPDGIGALGYDAFRDCANLVSVTIGEGLVSIKSGTFSGCEKLSNISLPNSLRSIGSGAFYKCISLTQISLNENVNEISNDAFSNCGLTSMVIPAGVTNIPQAVFFLCKDLETLYIPKGISTFDMFSLYGCEKLATIVVEEGNTALTIIDGNLYNIDGTILLKYLSGQDGDSFIIPESVTYLTYRSIAESTSLESVVIPTSVKQMEGYVFYLSTNLSTIYYMGSEAEWNAINKSEAWNYGMGEYQIVFDYNP